MKKEVRNYLSIGFLVLAALILAYLFNLRMTGYVSLLPEYGNQTACEEAGYVWEDIINETCSEIVGCEIGTGCVDTCEECIDEVIGQECSDLNYTTQLDCETTNETWEDIINITCTDILDCEVGVTGCVDTCEECVEEVIGEQCVGDVCGADFLELCVEADCAGAGGEWNTETSACDVIVACDPDTCAGLDYSCGSWDDGCGGTISCGTCDSGYECDAGSCEVIVEDTGDTEDTEDTGPEFNPYTVARASLGDIQEITLNQGGSQEVSMIVTNTGTGVLNSCIVKPLGEYDSWILVSEEVININIGDQHKFSFNIMVSEETEEGSYSLKVSFEGCLDTAVVKEFTVNVEEKKLEFNVISADRTRDDRVRVIYSLEELSGNDQDVVFIFSLVDANNVEVGRVEVNQSINANSSDEFRTNININESLLPINETTNETLESELTLHVNFNSQIYSSSIQEKVLIGTPIGGFAILEGVGAGEAIIFIVVLFVLVFIFVFARRMRRQGQTLRSLLNRK